MEINRMLKTFPCYKDDDGNILFDKNMLPPEAKEQDFDEVYRLCTNGVLDHEAFVCTYLDSANIKDRDLNYYGTYSTSCFNKYKSIKQLMKFMKRYHPEVIVAKGRIRSDSGFSFCDDTKKGHIHWWIYLEEKPEEYFYVFKESESYEKG